MPVPIAPTRRRVLAGLAVGAGAALIAVPKAFAAEAPPETATVRLAKKLLTLCNAPQYVADELLRAEGFTAIEYVPTAAGAVVNAEVARGAIDFSMGYAGPNIISVDAGEPIVNLAGVHVGCFELFAHGSIRSIAELKHKRVGIVALGSSDHVYLAAMLAYIGLDPKQDVEWVMSDPRAAFEMFSEGKVDAFLGFAPVPQDLRSRQVGHVIVNSAVDHPWS
jgi:NitT/TauT family transport system substrate-binding protein